MRLNFQEKGRAALEVDCIFKESTVTGAYATSPMKLLTPKSRGRCVCSYASNFGGGLVAGDQTRLDLRIGDQARCFIGTQASTKIYRNPQSLPCSHGTHATIGVGGLLVFAPSPVQPFAQSSYTQTQKFRLAHGAGLALLDWFTSGRAACGERWAFDHLSMRNEIWQRSEFNGIAEAPTPSVESAAVLTPGNEGKGATDVMRGHKQLRGSDHAPHLGCHPTSSSDQCVFLDSCCLDSKDGDLTSTYRTGRFNCFAMFVLIGSPLKKLADRIVEEVQRLTVKRRAQILISASPLKGGAVLRVAGEQVGEVDRYLRKHLALLADLLGEDSWSRRW
jgi:urease accessory protein UreH